MKYLPKQSFYDDVFDSMFDLPTVTNNSILKTDINELNGRYYLTVDVPGFKKEDIDISLYNGNLTISATKNNETNDKDEKGNVIRQERFYGKTSRSFYIGKGIKQEDIVANIDNGVLKINFPTHQTKEIEETKKIEII